MPRSNIYKRPAPFVDPALHTCDLMKGVSDNERELCKTGVMSIFIQMNTFANYGFSPKGDFATCNSLASSEQETCYKMSSLMTAQYDSGFARSWSICSGAAPALQRACVLYIPVGLFVNGVNTHSFAQALDFCAAVTASRSGYADTCYEQVGKELAVEYKSPSYIPDCTLFPAEYRDYCISPKIPADIPKI